ncbi:MAG TPA: hypothetical protein ENL37_05275 [Desulfobacteraceae bacterium]|nr:hypothetical protein [Desulfobacteraceae bacterium]
MKIKRLLDKLSGILNDERKKQIEKYKSLKKVLKALRNAKVILEETLAQTNDEELQHEIESRLQIISAQRKKGLKVLKDLKRERKGTAV